MHEDNPHLGSTVELAHIPRDEEGQLVHTAQDGRCVHVRSQEINVCVPELAASWPYFELVLQHVSKRQGLPVGVPVTEVETSNMLRVGPG